MCEERRSIRRKERRSFLQGRIEIKSRYYSRVYAIRGLLLLRSRVGIRRRRRLKLRNIDFIRFQKGRIFFSSNVFALVGQICTSYRCNCCSGRVIRTGGFSYRRETNLRAKLSALRLQGGGFFWT